MQKGKVNIAQGYPETLSKLKIFLEEQKRKHSENRLKTLEDAINFAIDEAEKVPALNKEINELRAECFALQKDKGVLLDDYQKARTQVKELEEERDMNEFYNDKIERMRMRMKELEEEIKKLKGE